MIGWPRPCSWLLVAALAAGLLAAVVRLAWLGDDAYITLRSVENLLAGHGPVWNVGERVQTFTHPAWFWLLAGARWLSGEHYFTTLAVSLAATAAGVALLLALARTPVAAAAVLVALLGSRAFGDYATSGLETPLAILLLAWLARLDERTPPDGTRLAAVGFAVGLLGTTRLDLLLLGGPLLLGQIRAQAPLRQAAVLLALLLPLVGWSLFAAFYYGSPFPITAYAKAFAPGVPAPELAAQGLRYLAHALRHDPLTPAVVAAGIVVGLVVPKVRGRLLALGALASCLYVVRVGGDFMAGRFLVPPFVVALALLARWFALAGAWAAPFAAGLCLGLPWLAGVPPFLRPPADDLQPCLAEHGIQDERRFWYAKFGLLSPQREIPQPGRFTAALRRQGRERPLVLGVGAAGGIPFVAGELFHFVDPWLCDPLLMRLPVAEPASWRIGHFTRAWPEGYAASLATGENRIEHPALRRFYATLRPVLRAPLAAPERWEALGALLGGAAGSDLRDYLDRGYRHPPRAEELLDALAPPVAAGTFWFDEPRIRVLGRGGLVLRSLGPRQATAMHVQVTPLVHYRFLFLAGGREVGRAELPALIDPGVPPAGDGGDVLGYLRRLLGLHRFAVPLPPGLRAFDAIEVEAQHEPWIVPALGGIELGA